MATFTELLGGLNRTGDNSLSLTIPESWMQGRTTYGGLTSAICYEAAKPLAGDKPLRSAQIAFVGPVGGDVTADARLLRMGKNTAFIGADLLSADGAVAARGLFAFGLHRESSISLAAMSQMPDVAAPETLESFFGGGPAPGFTVNFEMALAFGSRPLSGATTADLGLWLRHSDRKTVDDWTSILAIGDAPPPAAFAMFTTPIRISSMTWAIDILTDDPATEVGWWFARHTAETVQDGYSSQAMTLWNRSGVPIMTGRQTIAVFG